MICSKCGTQNMDGVTFCGSCGALLASPVPSTPPQQNSYDNQSQYQQPPLYGTGGYGMIPPKNYQTEAILVTVLSFICCCSPISVILGIIAIVKANNVKAAFSRGDYAEADNNAKSAKMLTIWAAVIAVAFYIICMIAYFLFFAAAINELGGWQELLNSMS